jgi:phosphate transport system substrate-binding protein
MPLALVIALVSMVALTPALRVVAQEATPAATITPYEAPDNAGDLEGSIEADGSSTVGPITEAVAEEFQQVAPNVQLSVGISGTGGGFERFCNGETDIQDASRPIDEEESALCAENNVEYYRFEVAFDGITVAVNKNNTALTCVSVESLAALWTEGSDVITFADLGEGLPDEEISLYGPGPDSGTFDFFNEVVLGEDVEPRTDYTPSEDDNVLVEGVAGDENALGYFGYAYYTENQDRLSAVAIATENDLSNCVAPSLETIADGTYQPLSRPIFIYVKAESLSRPEVQEFLRFYIANTGTLSEDVGYVAAPAADYAAAQEKLEGAIGGTAEPDSATTATPES